MGKPIALQIKEAIVSYWERNKEKNGGSGPTLSSLEEIFGVKRNTVFRILKKYKDTGTVANLPKGVRKRHLTARQERQVLLEVKRNPFTTLR